MPQGFAVARVEGEEVPNRIARKGQSRVRGKHAGAVPVVASLVPPANPASLVVDGLDHALAPQTIVRPRPAIYAIFRLGKIEAVAGLSIDDKQSGFGVEAWRTIVGEAALIRSDEAPVGRRLLVWIRNWLT